MCSLYITPKKFRNATINCHFGFVFEEKLVTTITKVVKHLVVFERNDSLRKPPFPFDESLVKHLSLFCLSSWTAPKQSRESTRRSSNKRIKSICKFIWTVESTGEIMETNDEIQPVFSQFLWTLKFISSSSLGKLSWCYFR